MQGESREDLSPCDPKRGVFSLERRCSDSALESWYEDVFPRFIERCRDLIIGDAGQENVQGLILTGSFASCEGSIIMHDGAPVFLSDIDLVLVVYSAASHTEIYNRRLALGNECEDLLPDARFEGRIDIGVITPGELAALPLSPGVFDIRERGAVLYGDSGILDRFPSFRPDEIGPAEALRLLENRMAVFLGDRPAVDRPEGKDLYRFLYGLSRVYTDIVTASLCAGGLYRHGYAARAEFLSNSDEASQVRDGLGGSLTDDAVRWTRFKTDPSADGFWKGDDRAGQKWFEAAGALVSARDRIRFVDHGSAFARRSSLRELFREWNAASRDRSFPRRLRLLAGAFVSGRDPGTHLREESVRLIRHAVENGTGGVVGPGPGGFPHGRTSWDRAARTTSAEWNRVVMGRQEESLEL